MAVSQVDPIVVGVLALQGAFAEHIAMLTRLPTSSRIVALAVRTPTELSQCHALIIPGGESTTIALLARLSELLEPLRDWVRHGRPTWGTCAGAILLAGAGVEGTKKGGQEVLGGLDVRIARNGFGSQVESFEANLQVDGLRDAHRPFPGVFIRAPVVLSLHQDSSHPPIRVLARVDQGLVPAGAADLPEVVADGQPGDRADRSVVALRQGNCMLTTFHPELTRDSRFHEYFLREIVGAL
ncbi:SNO glutamine amidotransferase [Auriculariales sp. MPI-PUGE-AT-0066]|nr:SNO glutamine amidotransferase [Auriculariales sp. MPI-PUGE-AT-0066]